MYSIPKKQAPLKTQVYKNPKYLSWLHNQGFTCLICSNTNIEIHHLESGAKGRPDNNCIVLCSAHHRTNKVSAHGPNAKEFKAQYQDMMEEEANTLFTAFESEVFA